MLKTTLGLRTISLAIVAFVFCLPGVPPAVAEWEVGIRAGYVSNVDHSIKDPESDSYISGFISYGRGISGESRLNWTFDASVEGVGYLRNEDLSYGELTLAPGLVYFLRHNWTVSVSPFIQGRAVKDSDQSAVTFGGKISVRERLNSIFYLSQSYLYRDSTASSSVYSAWEHVLGAVVGANWTNRFFTEIGYEFSHGDLFRSLNNSTAMGEGGPSGSGSGSGRGAQHRRRGEFSSTFDAVVFQETVDRHTVGLTSGVDWTRSLFSTVGYTYSIIKGGSGTSHDHAAFVNLGYRF